MHLAEFSIIVLNSSITGDYISHYINCKDRISARGIYYREDFQECPLLSSERQKRLSE